MYYNAKTDMIYDIATEGIVDIVKINITKAVNACITFIENIMMKIIRVVGNIKNDDTVLFASNDFVKCISHTKKYMDILNDSIYEFGSSDTTIYEDMENVFKELNDSKLFITKNQTKETPIKISVGKMKTEIIKFMTGLKNTRSVFRKFKSPQYIDKLSPTSREAFIKTISNTNKYMGILYRSFFAIILKSMLGSNDIEMKDINIDL